MPPMLISVHNKHSMDVDPFVSYSRSLHDYTLRLWTESRRIAESRETLRIPEKRGEGQRKSADTTVLKQDS